MQTLKYKYRLYPTPDQVVRLNQIVGSNRYVWNHFLSEEQSQYAINQKFRFYNTNSKDLTTLKKTTDWLNDTPSTSLQQTLRYLETALKQSFKRANARKGFPKFKKKRNFEGSFTLAMVNAKNFRDGKFLMPKIGEIKVKLHRELPSDFSTCQVKRDGDRWFVVCTVSVKKTQLPKTGKEIGIDLNSKEHVTSDGVRYKVPKYLHENQVKIASLQRVLARAVKGSKNRKKAQFKLHKVHQRVQNQRLDYFHKLSKALVTEYDLIALEDLAVAQIQRSRGKVIADNGFGMLRSMILYKSELYGKSTVIIDRYFPSSQTCSGCGSVHKMPTNIRTYVCPDCGLVMDRDLNASINILRAGTARIGGNSGNAFGDSADYEEQMVVLGILAGVNEEGSYVL